MNRIKPEIVRAIDEVRAQFAGQALVVEPDGQGGAFIRVPTVDLGSKYIPQLSWVGFQITFQYPFADVYPHYFHADLRRADNASLGEAIHQNHTFKRPSASEAAVMVSRKSSRRDAGIETAAIKLAKVLDWIRSR